MKRLPVIFANRTSNTILLKPMRFLVLAVLVCGSTPTAAWVPVSSVTLPRNRSQVAAVGLTDDLDGDLPSSTRPADSRQTLWAEAAYNYVRDADCRRCAFSTPAECQDVQRIARQAMNVYLADPSPRGRFKTFLPDGPLDGRGEAHDGVVLIDPYPEANFGHLVVVFHVTVGVSRDWCEKKDGKFVGSDNCLTLAVKKRCKNAVERRHRRRNFDRRCEINFLPVVSIDPSSSPLRSSLPAPHHHHHHHQQQQHLTCRTNVFGFSAVCPSLRTRNETSGLVCNPLRENSKRCETTHEMLAGEPGCRVFEICDRAVIISGGWNRWTHRRHHVDNMVQFYTMLRDHGFRKGNIKVFFANGASGIGGYGNVSESDVYPAAQKLVIRYHLQNLCTSLHCVDSLVIYLNSPALSDGTLLLWDVDHNGVASDDEKYTLTELKNDLSGCQARQVHVIVDQSYSGEIGRSMRRSSSQYRRISIYSSGRDTEYSFNNDFTTVWTRQNHTRQCMKDVFREARRTMRRSHPHIQMGDESAQNVNLFGAPCNVQPPFTRDELDQNYLGCQNLPTALWIMKLRKTSSGSGSQSSGGRARAATSGDDFR